MSSYHDTIATERWEMHLFRFILGLCEANSFSSFRIFSKDGDMAHITFKTILAYTLLKYCKKLINNTTAVSPIRHMTLRSKSTHTYATIIKPDSNKHVRLICRSCSELGASGARVGKSCSCDPTIPLCLSCYKNYLKQVW